MDSHRNEPTKAPRFTELDSLRGLAALGVVLWHYSGMYGAQPLLGALRPLYLSGGLLVDFFFVLSGFVLSRSFDRAGRRQQFGRNVWARIARMYPLHLLTLLVIVAVDGLNQAAGHPPRAANDGYHLALNLMLLQSSGLQHDYSFNGPSWSISAEFLINVVFLGLIARGGRLGRWAMALMALACAGVLVHYGILDHGVPVQGMLGGVLDVSLVRCWLGFFIGTQCYRYYQARQRDGVLVAHWRGDVVGVGALVLVLAYMARLIPQSHWGDVLLAALGFPGLILGTLHSRHLRGLLQRRPLTYLGEISYSIYLVHFPLIVISLWVAGFTGPLPMGSPWMLAGFYVLVLVSASASYRYVEMPSKRWLAGWWPAPQAGQAARAIATPARRVERPRPVGSRDAAYRRLAR
ncbi:MAG: acyltransferase [Dyella sp.]